MKPFTILFLLLSCFITKAQWGDEEMDEKPAFKDRIFTGGGIGLSFSNYSNYFSISPLIGYKVTNKLATGIQFQYRYTKYKIVTPSVSANDYGVSPFVRYNVYAPFFLHAEYEYLSYQFVYSSQEKVRLNFNSVMAGGGIFQSVGGRVGFYAMALYNFSYVASYTTSPYTSPLVLRAGITAGF